jgi:RNA polymerase sigma-70 factor (ECF subfamily)
LKLRVPAQVSVATDLPALSARPNALGDPFADEHALVAALRRRDRRAYGRLLDAYHTSMVRLAMMSGLDAAGAEETVEDAWVDVLEGVYDYDLRPPLKVWIFGLLLERLHRRIKRGSGARGLPPGDHPTVETTRFYDRHTRWPGHWAKYPTAWGSLTGAARSSREALDETQRGVEGLPLESRRVIALRDIEGWTADEVGELLEIDPDDQRRLLHQARSMLRRNLERRLSKS